MTTCSNGSRWQFGPSFRQLQREMDQLFDRALPEGSLRGKISAPLTLWEETDNLFVELDLPGLKQEDIDITIDKNLLKISAERKAPEAERKYWHQERSYGKVERVISLPETVATDAVEAEFKDGVLRVQLAKKPEVQPKKIAIRGVEVGNG